MLRCAVLQEFIDIVETVYRGARKGRGLVVSPKGAHSVGWGAAWLQWHGVHGCLGACAGLTGSTTEDRHSLRTVCLLCVVQITALSM